MSEENVDIVQKTWEAWVRGDLNGLLAYCDPEVVYDLTNFGEWPDNIHRGHEAMRHHLTEWLEVWDDYEVGVEEIRAAPHGRVVSLAWQRGRGRQSGLAMDMEWAGIATVRHGKIIRIEAYDDRAEALEAAGLSE
jgi:ketosteroid isomerase-like protein